MWMAGGGIRASHVHGATDDFGHFALEDRVHVHDINNYFTLFGINHESQLFIIGRDLNLPMSSEKVIIL